jgi:hypothetical protein
MQKSLMKNLCEIFSYSSHQFVTLLNALDLSGLKFEQFLRVLETANKFDIMLYRQNLWQNLGL